MTRAAPVPETVTLHVPFRLEKHGGRKEMVLPSGAPQQRKTDNTLVKALARAFRWKRMFESGEFATIAELAVREGIAPSYMTHVLRLTQLGPDLIDAILDGRQGAAVTLARLMEPFPVSWNEQKNTSRAYDRLASHISCNCCYCVLGQFGQNCRQHSGNRSMKTLSEIREVLLRTADRPCPRRIGCGRQSWAASRGGDSGRGVRAV